MGSNDLAKLLNARPDLRSAFYERTKAMLEEEIRELENLSCAGGFESKEGGTTVVKDSNLRSGQDARFDALPDCNSCINMSIPEEKQMRGQPHICKAYRKQCFHATQSLIHHKIYPCQECCADGFKCYLKVR